jgi:hypothetical protein
MSSVATRDAATPERRGIAHGGRAGRRRAGGRDSAGGARGTAPAASPTLDPAEIPLLASLNGRAVGLGGYLAPEKGLAREILAVTRVDASVLVLDCVEGSLQDPRVVACIAPEEPRENARIVCGLYLADETRGCCRPLTPSDLDPQPATARPVSAGPAPGSVIRCDGESYRIRTITADGRPRELRWTRRSEGAADDEFETVTLRDVTGRVEDYEPARSLTVLALEDSSEVSTVVIRCELERLAASPIVLNRGLREAVDRAVARGLTLSEIATRCGRVKRDARGNLSGETSWLGRRIGRLPEAGAAEPTPWVHSSTLALIAEGLDVNPNEVEL